jgi:hypothetical protein
VYIPDIRRKVIKDMVQCPTCGGLHDPDKKIPMYCDKIVKKLVFGEDGEVEEEKSVLCGGAMIEMSRWRREGLSQQINRKYKHFFRLYITDEIHKAKGGKTDVGAADSRLIESVKYGLALTGTLFSGNASSIFYLLFRRNPEVRKLYAYTDQTRWIDHFGLWERRWPEKEPKHMGRSWVTGKRRWGLRSKELPGVSPAVIRYLLPITLFGKITDLGYELPPLREHIHQVDLSPALQVQYEDFDKGFLKEAMRLAKTDGDPGALSKRFSTLRYRPMSAFRDEYPTYESKKTGEVIRWALPAVTADWGTGSYLPKERELAEIVKENVKKGIKTLVFAEQTGTRDIRSRLMTVLQTLVEGANIVELSASSISPAKREAWIKANASTMDVLIVNPKLVETGLDLVMFNDNVFYELPISLYTLWQAMRRVWRLGQKHAVKCRFLVYKETVEAALLDRMGKKLKAAMLLYGDEAAGAIIETDDTDLQREMIREALEGKSYKNLEELNEIDSLVKGLFSTGTEKEVIVTESPVQAQIVIPTIQIPSIQLKIDYAFEGPAQLSMFGSPVPAKQVKNLARWRR